MMGLPLNETALSAVTIPLEMWRGLAEIQSL